LTLPLIGAYNVSLIIVVLHPKHDIDDIVYLIFSLSVSPKGESGMVHALEEPVAFDTVPPPCGRRFDERVAVGAPIVEGGRD
jgi:hypothetical protein